MRYTFIILFLLLLNIEKFNAQAPPQGINYQAVIYDVEGSAMPGVDAYNLILANLNLSIRFTIIAGSVVGDEVYSEIQNTTTDEYGMISVIIGQGNPETSALFEDIDWSTGLHFLKVEVDKSNAGNFTTLSISQFWSVPYVLWADGANNGIQSLVENNNGTFTITYGDGSVQLVGPLGWTLVGNTDTNPSENFIGTIDSTDLVFRTNNLERMRMRKQGNIGLGTANPDNSAILELDSDSQGFLAPRMSRSERDNILTPANGLTIYNTTDSTLDIFNGECWLPSFLSSCDDCLFELSLSENSGNIDHITSDSIAINIQIAETSSTGQTISLFAIHNLPAFSSSYFTSDTVSVSGQSQFVVHASIFDAPGMYPIAIQGMCGNNIQTQVFYLTIDDCYQVTINSNQSEYDLQSSASLPGVGTPICVVVDVTSLATLSSNSAQSPTFSAGNLDPQSHVGIRNYGKFLARGGNGGLGGNFSNFGNPGENGGNAINATCQTSILNYGFIYGGGGGGGSVGLSTTFNIPFFGDYTFGIGAGGGGGCQLGLGGGSGTTVIGIWDDGNDATGGISAVPGNGGAENIPISLPLGPVTLTVTPDAYGGDGGNYGLPGNSGSLNVTITATVPLIGSINIPTPTITNFPSGGMEGFAVKKNGNILNGITNGNYQLNNLKGQVND